MPKPSKQVTFGDTNTEQTYDKNRPSTIDPNILEINPHIQPEPPDRTWLEYIYNYYLNLFPDSTGINHHSEEAIRRSEAARRRRHEPNYHDEQKEKKEKRYAYHKNQIRDTIVKINPLQIDTRELDPSLIKLQSKNRINKTGRRTHLDNLKDPTQNELRNIKYMNDDYNDQCAQHDQHDQRDKVDGCSVMGGGKKTKRRKSKKTKRRKSKKTKRR